MLFEGACVCFMFVPKFVNMFIFGLESINIFRILADNL